MELNFLCVNHKKLFRDCPKQAFTCCLNTLERWRKLFSRDSWAEAVPYIGCAWETAQIMTMSDQMETSTSVDWLLYTTRGLAETLKKTGRLDLCIEAYQLTIKCLKDKAEKDPASEQLIEPKASQISDELLRIEALVDWENSATAQRVIFGAQTAARPSVH